MPPGGRVHPRGPPVCPRDDVGAGGNDRPQPNAVVERSIRTLKEQYLWARLYQDTADMRQGVATFIATYNNEWLTERLGHRTPREAFSQATAQVIA
ncbi:MAG: integrase core domain-containing protein [Acidimicrobiales bacterium]